jgi:cell division protein FtsW (lipid II flippase)
MGSAMFLRGLGVFCIISGIVGGIYFIATLQYSKVFLAFGDFVVGAFLVVIGHIGENVYEIKRKLIHEQKEEEEKEFTCSECGADIGREQKYCPYCGIQMDWSEFDK